MYFLNKTKLIHNYSQICPGMSWRWGFTTLGLSQNLFILTTSPGRPVKVTWIVITNVLHQTVIPPPSRLFPSPFREKLLRTLILVQNLNAIFRLFGAKRNTKLKASTPSCRRATQATSIEVFIVNSERHHKRNGICASSGGGAGVRNGCLPWLSVEVLFMSPEMKEDSDCFLTVSFHIRLMRLWVERKAAIDQDSTWCRCYSRLLALNYTCLHASPHLALDDVPR